MAYDLMSIMAQGWRNFALQNGHIALWSDKAGALVVMDQADAQPLVALRRSTEANVPDPQIYVDADLPKSIKAYTGTNSVTLSAQSDTGAPGTPPRNNV